MALSKFLRRISCSVISSPLSIRPINTQRIYYSSVITPLNSETSGGTSQDLLERRRNSLPITYFSSSFTTESGLDENHLLKLIDYEIKWAQESTKVKKIPVWFAFELEDNPGGETISLRREYDGEIIKVEVQIPSFANKKDEDIDDEKDGEIGGDENGGDSNDDDSIPLVTSVSKGSGTCLEFGVTAFPYQEKISIDLLSIKTPNTYLLAMHMRDLNSPSICHLFLISEKLISYFLLNDQAQIPFLCRNLQEALYKYLDIRGITPTTTKYLCSYMINKESREYLMWLKNVKKFLVI